MTTEDLRLALEVRTMERDLALKHLQEAEAEAVRIDAQLLECATEVGRLRAASQHPAYVAVLKATRAQVLAETVEAFLVELPDWTDVAAWLRARAAAEQRCTCLMQLGYPGHAPGEVPPGTLHASTCSLYRAAKEGA